MVSVLIVVICCALAAPVVSIKATYTKPSAHATVKNTSTIGPGNASGMTKFVVIANHRTGSTMLVNLLNSHPEVAINRREWYLSRGSPKPALCLKQNLTLGSCVDATSRILNDDNPRDRLHAFGIKLMLDQVDNVPGGIAHHDGLKYVVHFRRNVLRTMISDEPTLYKPGTPRPHAFNDTEAQAARGKKAHIFAHDLIEQISQYEENQCELRRILKALGNKNICSSYYEDWIDPRERSAQMKALESCLGVEHLELKQSERSIWEIYPILDTISNPEEVVNALKGSRYEFMLEDAALSPRPKLKNATEVEYGYLDPASSAAVFDNLKVYDSYC